MQFVPCCIAFLFLAYYVMAEQCEPRPTPDLPRCITDCTVKAGREVWDKWTMDPKSDDFDQSMRISCRKDLKQYKTYLDASTHCIMGCKTEEIMQYNNESTRICTWYYQEENADCIHDSSAAPMRFRVVAIFASMTGTALLAML